VPSRVILFLRGRRDGCVRGCCACRTQSPTWVPSLPPGSSRTCPGRLSPRPCCRNASTAMYFGPCASTPNSAASTTGQMTRTAPSRPSSRPVCNAAFVLLVALRLVCGMGSRTPARTRYVHNVSLEEAGERCATNNIADDARGLVWNAPSLGRGQVHPWFCGGHARWSEVQG